MCLLAISSFVKCPLKYLPIFILGCLYVFLFLRYKIYIRLQDFIRCIHCNWFLPIPMYCLSIHSLNDVFCWAEVLIWGGCNLLGFFFFHRYWLLYPKITLCSSQKNSVVSLKSCIVLDFMFRFMILIELTFVYYVYYVLYIIYYLLYGMFNSSNTIFEKPFLSLLECLSASLKNQVTT